MDFLGGPVFVTMPHFEQPFLSNLAGDGQQYWRAVTLSAHAPWYVFLYEAPIADGRFLQSTLVAWEETVLNLLEVVPRDSWRGIYRLEPATQKTGGWRFREVSEIWTPTQSERESGLTAVLLLEGDAQLRDPQLQPVERSVERHLAYRAKNLSGGLEQHAASIGVAGKGAHTGRGGAGS
jgi:hypothetical protein